MLPDETVAARRDVVERVFLDIVLVTSITGRELKVERCNDAVEEPDCRFLEPPGQELNDELLLLTVDVFTFDWVEKSTADLASL